MSQKKQFKIYQILSEVVDKDNRDKPKKVLETLINIVNKNILENGGSIKFKRLNAPQFYKKIFKTLTTESCLYKGNANQIKMYDNFFSPDILGGEKFEKTEDMFVCFIIIETEIYFFSSSYVFSYFIPYINEDFGIDVSKKLINGNIKNEKTISITGETLTSDIIFRRLKSFSKFDNIGKVVKGFLGEIDKKKSRKILDLIIPKNEHVFCDIGNAFQLKKGLEFDLIIELTKDIHNLFKEEELSDDYEDFQMLKKINPRISKNKNLIGNIKKCFFEEVYEYYKSRKQDFINNIDLVHPTDFKHFIESIQFKIDYEGKENFITEGLLDFKKIIDFIKEENSKIKDYQELQNILKEEISVYGINSDENQILDSHKNDIFNYVISEITYRNKKYFIINGSYYLVKDDFIDTLNKELCKEFLENNVFLPDNIFKKLKKWEKIEKTITKDGKKTTSLVLKNEGDYNLEYLREKKFIVLDKVFYNNIEFCDLLYSKEGQTFLFHNKIGFDGDMRILSEQVLLSALTLSEERRNGKYNKIKKYYESLKNKDKEGKTMKTTGEQVKSINQNQFVNKFIGKVELNFVLGFTYNREIISIFKSGDKENILNELNNLSIIAKYELLNLIKKMRLLGINFFITQIPTDYK